MDFDRFLLENKPELLYLEFATKLQQILINTHSKPQEPLEFKMKSSRQIFSIAVLLVLEQDCMMGIIKSKVYNTVHDKIDT